ncbi:hypothetical protein BMS3Abin13_00746 [bacterium BMS3Abin13]|nr:hypothetical protein BMS3Abin13_00746 [bacterium BMS3Abin13]
MATKKKTPLRSTPKMSKGRDLDKFAADAERKSAKADEVYPWEEPHVREDVKKTLPLRIDEPLYLKLKFIAKHTPYSMNSFILNRVIDEIEEEITRLTE